MIVDTRVRNHRGQPVWTSLAVSFILLLPPQSTIHDLAFDRKLVSLYTSSLHAASPLRLRAMHLLYSDPKVRLGGESFESFGRAHSQSHLYCYNTQAVAKIFLPAYLWFCGPFVRQRARFHTGSPKELRLDLEEYGLPDVNDGDKPCMPPRGLLAALKARET